MSPPEFPSNLVVLVLFNIRKFCAFRRERRNEVANGNVCIWNGGIRRSLVGVMPISAWRVVSFKYMNVVTCLGELPIGNEPTECLNEYLKHV